MHSVREMVDASDRRELAKMNLESDDNSEDEDLLTDEDIEARTNLKKREDRLCQAFKVVCQLIPGFEKTISTADDGEQTKYLSMLEKHASTARGDDISKVKSALASIINSTEPMPSPLLEANSKSNRGFQHDATGLRLCPIHYDFRQQEVRDKIRACDSDFPTNDTILFHGLYADFRGDPSDVEKGFLKSGELIKLAKVIFTSSPSAAKYDVNAVNQIPAAKISKVPTKQNVAQLLGLTAVTPPLIAYVATMYHFGLTDASSWDVTYNGFDYIALYDTIVDYFTDATPGTPGAEQSKEILSWWNRHVFPEQQSAAAAATAAVSFRNALKSQRAAKAAAASVTGTPVV
ncbi:hypothetical protein EV361DRAFT_931598 [Lentinula raphanica]|nr:hypothetical protein EV361DRAFT_931598 [Lentinula raphanica]